MQIAHRKTQTDHKLLSDRTEALAARLEVVNADLRNIMYENGDDAEALRRRVMASEGLLAELQARLSSAEAAAAEMKAQAKSRAAEELAALTAAMAANVAPIQVSPCTHAPSALGAHMAQSDVLSVKTPTRKRKRAEDDDDDDAAVEEADDDDNDDNVRPRKAQRRKRVRRFAWAAVHTAAAAAVGAVAAWSALAFA